MAKNKMFVEYFNIVAGNNLIEIAPEHHNGTGYFDGLMMDSRVTFDRYGTAAARDHAGRRIVILKTPIDNIVVFERYSNDPSTPITTNHHSFLADLDIIPYGSLTEEQLHNVLGYSPDSHVGRRLDKLFRAMKAREKVRETVTVV